MIHRPKVAVGCMILFTKLYSLESLQLPSYFRHTKSSQSNSLHLSLSPSLASVSPPVSPSPSAESCMKRNVVNNRRDFFKKSSSAIIAVPTFAGMISLYPQSAKAKTEVTSAIESLTPSSTLTSASTKPPNFTQTEIASFLHPIPTFTIVDTKGVPFMVVGEDAKLTAYFFTSYDEANRILNSATTSTDKVIQELKNEINDKRKLNGQAAMTKSEVVEEVGVNPWKKSGDNGGARVSTVPLDFGVGLASRGKVAGSYFRIAPSEEDVQDSLSLDTSVSDLAEGKVPLFYIDDFEIVSSSPSSSASDSKIPLYFQKSQLLDDYNKRSTKNKENDEIPQVKVTELFSLLGQMAGNGEIDDDIRKLELIAPRNSEAKAKECLKKGGKESAYKLGERIVVL